MYDFETIKRWHDLSDSEKSDYFQKFNVLISYLKKNENKILPWSIVDNYVGHIYRFTIDDWNASHFDPEKKLEFDDVDMRYACLKNHAV